MDTRDYAVERSLEATDSANVIQGYLDGLNMMAVLDTLRDDLEVSHTVLKDRQGKVVSGGSGKGTCHEIGSLAESVEHFALGFAKGSYNKTTLGSVAKQKNFGKDWFLKSLAKERGGETLTTATFKCFQSKDKCQIPASYTDPTFCQHSKPGSLDDQIAKFSSNTGTSVGLTLEDSWLHGLNEQIERQYLSLLYQQIIGTKKDVKWYLYADKTNQRYSKKCSAIEKHFGKKVITIIAPTPFDTFVSFSVLDNEEGLPFYVPTIGGGCSLYPGLALQRGVDELSQCLFLKNHYREQDKTVEKDLIIFKNLHYYKGLHPIIYLAESLPTIATKKFEDKSDPKRYSTKEQVEMIVNKMAASGYPPLHKEIIASGGIFVTQIFIPGFDKFFLIREGNMVAPLDRYRVQA